MAITIDARAVKGRFKSYPRIVWKESNDRKDCDSTQGSGEQAVPGSTE